MATPQRDAAELIRLLAELRHHLAVFQDELARSDRGLLILAAVNLELALEDLDEAFKRVRTAAHLISKS